MWTRFRRFRPSEALAIGAGAAIAMSRLLLQEPLGANAPFILAWPAVLLSAFLGGFWPALLVGLVGLWVGQEALTAGGAGPLKIGGIAVYMAFILVFAVAGGLRKRGLRRQQEDAERLSQMGARLSQVARLNAMGEMAGVLAHELNQPLTAIASYAGAAEHLARRPGADAGEVADLLRKVAEQTVRARDIIGRIRGYVAGAELDLQSHPLRELFAEAVAMATVAEGEAPILRQDFDSSAERVLADRIQIQQVMVNLVRNAAEAMRHAPRRELRIGSRPAGEGLVEVFVTDTGPGVSPELIDRLFEPFVTDKPAGTGIGLAICRSIVEAHGGKIWAEAGPGGATFRFTLKDAREAALA